MDMQRFLIGLGLVILVAGIAWPLLSRIGLGRLPGDIVIHRGGTTFYFPLVTCIIISIVLSAVLAVQSMTWSGVIARSESDEAIQASVREAGLLRFRSQ